MRKETRARCLRPSTLVVFVTLVVALACTRPAPLPLTRAAGVDCKVNVSGCIGVYKPPPCGLQICRGDGPVLTGATNVYLLFYGTWSPEDHDFFINLVSSLGGSAWYGVLGKFTDSQNRPVPNALTFKNYIDDAYSIGTRIDDSSGAIPNLIRSKIHDKLLPADRSGIYVWLGSADVDVIGVQGDGDYLDPTSNWCAYHSADSSLYYAVVPQPRSNGPDCFWPGFDTPNRKDLDAMATSVAHEIIETVTDPDTITGWTSGGWEDADLCNYNCAYPADPGTAPPPYCKPVRNGTLPNGTTYDIKLGHYYYELQPSMLLLPQSVAAEGGDCVMDPFGGNIGVQSAIYGENCPTSANVTSKVGKACNDQATCAFAIDVGALGDPSPGCAKDFVVNWSCLDGPHTLTVPAEANGQRVTLSCSCTPNCDGKTCGPDGCGGTCGKGCAFGRCADTGQGCACTPRCADRACGPDGCGGSCGTCPNGPCSPSGQCTSAPVCEQACRAGLDACLSDPHAIAQECEAIFHRCVGGCLCVPKCVGACSSDGCGSCGVCPFGYCDGTNCVCTPSCANRACGGDGCGGSCGDCPPGAVCDGDGRCVCNPSCAGRNCGVDGCGHSCGTCPAQETCGTGGRCICTPNCAGKACGADGCGGSCGACKQEQLCVAGHCSSCIPDCNHVCGPDGCGGHCGSCKPGEACGSEGCRPYP
jgi:phosphate-induced protein 1